MRGETLTSKGKSPRDHLLRLDSADILEPGWEGDPMELIEDFFADLEDEVQDTCSAASLEWKAAGWLYFQNITQCKVASPLSPTRASVCDQKSSTTPTTSPDFCHPLMLDVSGHVNEKNKFAQTGDGNTVATVDESLDSGSSWAVSDDEDGTQYFDAGNSSQGETKKEQSRRLLIQHRNSQAQIAKPNSISRRMTKLLTIKEEDCIDEGSVTIRANLVESQGLTGQDDFADDDRRREIQIFLERKFKSSGGVRRNSRRARRERVKVGTPVNFFRTGDWSVVGLTVAYVILLFSSSAGRYAKFRSNLRFKPGD